MPKFVNENDHPVRVEDENGRLRRLVPGQVVEADGAFADNLKSTDGVSSAKGDHSKAWEQRQAQGAGPSGEDASLLAAKLAIGPSRVALRHQVHAPLRRVIGDDLAPYGPPSGTITTKHAAAQASPEDRRAFADHEALEPVDSDDEVAEGLPRSASPSARAIHNAQHENAQAAEQAAEQQESEGEQPEGQGS